MNCSSLAIGSDKKVDFAALHRHTMPACGQTRGTDNTSLMEACLYAALLMVWCVQVKSEAACDETEFFLSNGTCAACLLCGPGTQLSEDCGFGDGAAAVCIPCEDGRFSADTGVGPCMRCTQCNLLNRLENTRCSSTRDARCGQCIPGHYELRSVTGEVELPCVPCSSRGSMHKACLRLTAQSSKGGGVKENAFPIVLIGLAAASSSFLLALLFWAFLVTAGRSKQIPKHCPDPEGLMSADGLQLPAPTKRAAPRSPSKMLDPALQRDHATEVPPTSIVINVTTNIKPSGQNEESSSQEEQQSSCSVEEMEEKLQTIWEKAQGQTIETLDYDSVQDLSLLLDSASNSNVLRRLGRSLGVPPQVIAHLKGFQDLFQYLCTSSYTLLPQLAQAAALLPHPEVVARIHRAVTT
ncbi:tumor necrosis factor receptor superfamily member EDAR-like [Brachionichthys hirsutus]|uniref:tumor necrosis factor receptor superfamily member EDAR-like n=1 Tax=Brachionichthys hirsutus TaxID=412623 RepID=UPI003604B4F3